MAVSGHFFVAERISNARRASRPGRRYGIEMFLEPLAFGSKLNLTSGVGDATASGMPFSFSRRSALASSSLSCSMTYCSAVCCDVSVVTDLKRMF